MCVLVGKNKDKDRKYYRFGSIRTVIFAVLFAGNGDIPLCTLFHPFVQVQVNNPSFFDRCAALDAYFAKAVFFEHPHRRCVVFEDRCEQADQFGFTERILADRAHGIPGYTPVPVRFADPVADFSAEPFHVALAHQSDPAGRFAVDDDGKFIAGRLRNDIADKETSVLFGIGMGETVADVAPDVYVVRVAG